IHPQSCPAVRIFHVRIAQDGGNPAPGVPASYQLLAGQPGNGGREPTCPPSTKNAPREHETRSSPHSPETDGPSQRLTAQNPPAARATEGTAGNTATNRGQGDKSPRWQPDEGPLPKHSQFPGGFACFSANGRPDGHRFWLSRGRLLRPGPFDGSLDAEAGT